MDRLSEIRERLGKITPGPWVAFSEELCVDKEQNIGLRYPVIASYVTSREKWFNKQDAAFVANAPADIAYLLDLVDELKCCENCANYDPDKDTVCCVDKKYWQQKEGGK